MATNPSNANPGLTLPDSAPQENSLAVPAIDGRDALQALLAFSTLHEQIRRRRAQAAQRQGERQEEAEDIWACEQFLLDDVLQLVAERAQIITASSGIAIALAEGEEIICRASVGSMAPDRGARLDPWAGFSGACLRTRRIIRCDDSEHDPRVDLHACRRLGTRSMVAVPLLSQNSVVGILEAFSTEPFGFSDNHVRSLNLLAELILAALKPEDEERIVRAAQAASAEFQASEIDRLRQLPIDLAPVPAFRTAAPEDVPLEFSKEDIAPPLYEASTDNSQPGVLPVLAVVLTGALLLGGLWWKVRTGRGTPTAAAATEHAAPQKPTSVSETRTLTGAATPASLTLPELSAGAESLAPPLGVEGNHLRGNVLPQITGVRRWSAGDTSTVAIDLQAEVQYETHRLENPDRIYFDLRDTSLAPSLNAKTIDVGDSRLVKVRVAQPVEGITRIVLETRGVSNFSVSMRQNPYQLLIEVRGPDPKPAPPSANPVSSTPLAPAPAPLPQKAATAVPAPPVARPSGGERSSVRAQTGRLRVVLDAGHGGWDLGTVGRRGLLEKDLVLEVAQRLGALLQQRLDAEVIFTRKDDNYLSLEQRAELANQVQADFFISVHANYSDLASARGVETYYSSFFSPPEAREFEFAENSHAKPVTQARLSGVELKEKVDGSRELAAYVQRALFGSLATASPGIRNRGVREASYVVLTGTEMPSILAEISFVSSPADEERLRGSAYRQEIAEALYKGIAQYSQSSRHVKLASNASHAGGR